MNFAFTGARNQFRDASKLLGPDTEIAETMAEILKAGRISLLCAEKERKAKTAYMLLETDSAELDRMYEKYSPLAAMLGGVPAKIDGWDSAMSMTIPFEGGTSANIVLAHKKGALLAGFGDVEDFSKTLETSGDYGDYLSKDNLMNVIVSSKIYDIAMDMLENAPTPAGREVEAITAGIDAFRKSFSSIRGNLKPDGKLRWRIVAAEGGDPIAALFELFSRTIPLMPRPASRP
jgi:hypothetical protein